MINPIHELDKAQLKHDFRQMYNEIGLNGCWQVLYELLVSANLLMEVMKEENNLNDDE